MSQAQASTPDPGQVWYDRWRARAWLWGNSSLQGVRQCGRIPQSGTGSVRLIRHVGGQVSPMGLQHCHSIWACPICSAQIISTRADRLQKLIDGWHGDGHRIGFITLTLRHLASEPLTQVWDRVMRSWQEAQGNGWRRDSRRWGVDLPSIRRNGKVDSRVSFVRTVEVTHGRHGWHVHLHVLAFFRGGDGWQAEEQRWAELSSVLAARWQTAVVNNGGKVDPRVSAMCELVSPAEESSARVGRYLAKSVMVGSGGKALHWEASGGRAKEGRNGSRTPWQILEDASAGDERSAALWHVYEAGSKGKRQMAVPGPLLDRYGLRDETDAEALEIAGEAAEAWVPSENSAL